MNTREQAAATYIENQFRQIVELLKFEPADTHTAQGIQGMMENILSNLLSKELLFDYVISSMYAGSTGIITSVVFKTNRDSEFIFSSLISHESFLPTIEEKNETDFLRAMKGV